MQRAAHSYGCASMPKIPKKPAKPISIEDMNEAMSDASYMAALLV